MHTHAFDSEQQLAARQTFLFDSTGMPKTSAAPPEQGHQTCINGIYERVLNINNVLCQTFNPQPTKIIKGTRSICWAVGILGCGSSPGSSCAEAGYQ